MSPGQWLRRERAKLEGYPLRDKLRYVWQYYRLFLIGAAFFLGFGGYALHQYLTVPGDIHFYGIFSNTYAPLSQTSAFGRDFIRFAGFDLETGVVELDCANYCSPSRGAVGNTYYEKLISMLDSGTDDVWVTQREDIISVGETGRLMDLDAGPEALRRLYGDRFVYCTPLREDYSTEPVPVGIDLEGTVLTGPGSAYPDGAVLGINAYTHRSEAVLQFLSYLFGNETEG